MKQRRKKLLLGLGILIVTILTVMGGELSSSHVQAAKKPTFTITPKTGSYKKKYDRSSNYTKYTRNWLTMRSYMQLFEKKGGGTLILKKGTYNLSNPVYIPSNVTVKLSDGVVINKIMKTGTNQIKPSMTIFQLVPDSKFQKNDVIGKYNGSKNVKIIGTGKVVINLKNIKSAMGIVAGHNKNVLIEGITFKNHHTGHFIEADAVNGLTVNNCTFEGAAKGSPYAKEAINIDTPDPNTNGFNVCWSISDRTPNCNVTITGCTFKNLQRGVGTHKYAAKKTADGKYSNQVLHSDIRIENNQFINMKDTAIFMMSWKNVTVLNNTFNKGGYAFAFRGVKSEVLISNNVLKEIPITEKFGPGGTLIQRNPYKNVGSGSMYGAVVNDFNYKSIAELEAVNTLS